MEACILYRCKLEHLSVNVGDRSEEVIEDVVWNLRTWPLELVEWETKNSHRLDIQFNPEQDR